MKLLIATIIFTISLFSNELLFKTFQSNFIQSIKNQSGNVITYKGSIHTDGENILWKYTNPILKEVYILDTNIIINEPELEQTIYTSLSNELNLKSLLQNAKQITKSEYITNLNDIEYTLLFKNKVLKSISYLDEVEHQVSIIFQNPILDQKINSKIFLFKQNPNFDIIKQ